MWPIYIALMGTALYIFYKNLQEIENNIIKKNELSNGKNVSYTIEMKEKESGKIQVTKDSRQNNTKSKIDDVTTTKIQHRAHSGGGFVTLKENNKGTMEEHMCYAKAKDDKWIILSCRK